MCRALPRIALCALIIQLLAYRGGADTSAPPSDLGQGHNHRPSHSAGAVPGATELVEATPNSPAYVKLGPGVEVIDDLAVAARAESSTFTHEGHFAPLLFGSDLRAFSSAERLPRWGSKDSRRG